MASSLKTITIKQDPLDEAHIDDCQLIQSILIDKGYYATIEQCHILWKMHSENYAASWLILYEDRKSIYEAIRTYFYEDQTLFER